MNKEITFLGIETSCDETAAAVIRENSDGSAKILSNAEHGRELSYLDEYPKIIESISLSEVNSAIKKYVNPNKLYMVAAGTL